MKYQLFLLLVIGLVLSMVSVSTGSEVKKTDTFSPNPQYEVETFEAVLHQAGLFNVRGTIRNTDIHATIGYAIIYFANDNEEIIAVGETTVNEKKAIDPGDTGVFELSKKIKAYKNITKTYIEYVVKEKIIKPKKPLISIGVKP